MIRVSRTVGLTGSGRLLVAGAMLGAVAALVRSASAGPWTGRRARLDPALTQIVFADLQPDLIGGSRTVAPDNVAVAAGKLAEVAARLEIPTLFSLAPQGATPPRVIDALVPHATPETTIARPTAGALMDARTAGALRARGRPVLVVAGFASEVVVLQTVLDAVAAGYEVHYVTDAIGGLSERSERAAFAAMDAAGARPTSVVTLAGRLAPDFHSPPGADILGIIKSMTPA